MKSKIIVALLIMNMVISASAQNQNQYGLVYRDAISENVVGKVTIHPVSYEVGGIGVVANIYTPANYDSSKEYVAIVIAHPNGGVKEQVAGLYAQRLAELGYITIDARYQGASGGEPRNTDRPPNRIEDIHGMVDFISQYPGVDASRIGALGICGGGGYTLGAAQGDKRIKAVATLSMFNSGRVRRNGFQDSQINTIQQRLTQAAEARNEEAKGKVLYTGEMNISDEEAAKLPFALYRDGYEYYFKTHAHPNSTFRYTMSSLLDLMTWDATDHIDLIDQPLLLIAGSDADTKYMSDEAFEKATGTKDKEMYLIPGAEHIKTYFVPEYVNLAVNKMKDFFGMKL
jgi:fermentation-respiration switch protein FrsA (DUF1100 family)